jgi:hypothetical protein
VVYGVYRVYGVDEVDGLMRLIADLLITLERDSLRSNVVMWFYGFVVFWCFGSWQVGFCFAQLIRFIGFIGFILFIGFMFWSHRVVIFLAGIFIVSAGGGFIVLRS